MRRRDFLKFGMYSLTGLAASSSLAIPKVFRPTGFSTSPDGNISLSMSEAFVEMINLERVYMWLFADPEKGPRYPGTVILAEEGQRMRITVTNGLHENHAFFIPGPSGRPIADSGPMRPGETKVVEFNAPAAGTYMYYDNLNAPVNRVMGLSGVMTVMPKASGNPYGSGATRNIQRLFDDLGTTEHFPGDPWLPERTHFWTFHEIDPSWNLKIMNGEKIDPKEFVRGFLPRYFTLSGKSGIHSSFDPDVAPKGTVGQPFLVRMLGMGLMTHSLHTHGNHHYITAANGRVQENVIELDTTTIGPLDIIDIMIPMKLPTDIPLETWPPKEEGFPQLFIVHDHVETGQTADGGNYPHGITTHIVFTGPYGNPVADEKISEKLHRAKTTAKNGG